MSISLDGIGSIRITNTLGITKCVVNKQLQQCTFYF